MNRAVAIYTANFDGSTRFVVENSRAVAVLLKMTICAVHALFQMNILQVNSFLKFVRIIGVNCSSARVEKISFPVFLVDVLKYPAMPVRVRELNIF